VAAVRQAQSLRVDLPGRLAPGEVIRADMNALRDAPWCASLAGVSLAVWLAQGPPADRPGLWRLSSVRAWYQSRLG
jgi:hypothetical protein